MKKKITYYRCYLGNKKKRERIGYIFDSYFSLP